MESLIDMLKAGSIVFGFLAIIYAIFLMVTFIVPLMGLALITVFIYYAIQDEKE